MGNSFFEGTPLFRAFLFISFPYGSLFGDPLLILFGDDRKLRKGEPWVMFLKLRNERPLRGSIGIHRAP